MDEITVSPDEFADAFLQMIVDGTNEIIEDAIREIEEDRNGSDTTDEP